MLTLSLRSLERNGLVTRTVHPDSPPRVEYATTPLIEEIVDPLKALADWAARSRPTIAADRRAYDGRQ
ncbi:winged helix-turn-helix transcriptional regulator [Micromonospora sp. CA-111912]|uniref:winged helix-turn-helix transcriptional regulator n=1 Tax=Micromonospora sp. CA-111912 TaxID=3239955 RepID=UPI003D931DB7